jgi:predicted acylesterase/phospholipase RssA
VLREAGVPIDYVVGVSVGSIFGLGLAADLPTSYIHAVVRNNSAFEMFRFYAGRLRADRRNPIARMVWEAGGGRQFEDLPTEFAVVATDMETARPVAFTRGPIVPALEASIALPFIAKPACIDGRYYVDGGIIDTAPVPIARNMGADIVIAVCLGLQFAAPAFMRSRPWTRNLVDRMAVLPGAGPRLRDQIRFGCRVFSEIYDVRPTAADADIAIWPEFGPIRPNGMRGAERCLEQGIRAAEEALPTVLELLQGAETSAPPPA